MDNKNDTILEARSLYKSFEAGGRSLEVLNGVNIDISRGELVAVMGCLLYTSPSPRDRG